MATVALTVGQVHGHTTPNGFAKGSDNLQVMGCFVSITAVAGTYAAADDATATAVNNAIRDSRRDGRAVTLMRACMAAPGKKSDGTVIGFGSAAAPGNASSNNIVGQLTQADLATEHADGALNDTFLEPIVLFVLYKH